MRSDVSCIFCQSLQSNASVLASPRYGGRAYDVLACSLGQAILVDCLHGSHLCQARLARTGCRRGRQLAGGNVKILIDCCFVCQVVCTFIADNTRVNFTLQKVMVEGEYCNVLVPCAHGGVQPLGSIAVFLSEREGWGTVCSNFSIAFLQYRQVVPLLAQLQVQL